MRVSELTEDPTITHAAELPEGVPVPKLFTAGPGLRLRQWEFERWTDDYGHFDSLRISHGFHIHLWKGELDIDHCQAAVMQADLGCHHQRQWADEEAACQCVVNQVHRPMCLFCDWEGSDHEHPNDAAQEALDHAWPGWRSLPDAPRRHADTEGTSATAKAKLAAWVAAVNAIYPPGWLEQGGPIITVRNSVYGRRHAPNHTPFGGYDVAREYLDEGS